MNLGGSPVRGVHGAGARATYVGTVDVYARNNIKIVLPEFGSWSMSPSRISDSGTCSIACSELITHPGSS